MAHNEPVANLERVVFRPVAHRLVAEYVALLHRGYDTSLCWPAQGDGEIHVLPGTPLLLAHLCPAACENGAPTAGQLRRRRLEPLFQVRM
jgi:hypothetical protein